MFTTPILLITFNRADHVRNVLTEIRNVQPTELYIAQDGPRLERPDDAPKIKAVRNVIKEMVDWPCNLHTHYSEANLGCGRGPYEAMSWFFRHVEYGIILEDDIIPHPLFWPYMEELLERYKDDNRVGMVCAHNLQRYYSRHNSYYFTHEMAGTLGWGTWRRVWKDFDFDIPYDEEQLSQALRWYRLPSVSIQRSCAFYEKYLSMNRHDCWDIQFDYYLLVNHYLNARANSCLTSHEGDDVDATHSGYVNPGYKMEIHETRFTPIIHPKKVIIDSSVRFRVFKKEVHLLLKMLHKLRFRIKKTIELFQNKKKCK